jgi:hypothetical protein
VSYWRNGRQSPGAEGLRKLLRFFDLQADLFLLIGEPFEELLAGPYSDPEHFRRVEAKIRG